MHTPHSPARQGALAARLGMYEATLTTLRSRSDNCSLATVLPPMFVILLISTMWSVYFSLHLLPLLQIAPLGEPPWEPEAAPSGQFQCVVSQVLFFMVVLCYARSVVCCPGTVPMDPEWKMGYVATAPLTREVKITGERRHCKWCLMYKPDRCHHCRVCRSCVLKMDHHCPWIMNCVGFRNHKYFFLLVGYSVLSCMFINFTLPGTVLRSMDQDLLPAHRFLLVLCLTLSLAMGALLLAFLAFHTWLMLQGMTTIEFCEKTTAGDTQRRGGRYDAGLHRNICAVLGPQPLLWFLPCSPPAGDGVHFPAMGRDAEADDPEWTGYTRASLSSAHKLHEGLRAAS